MSLVIENTKILEFLELVGRLKHVKRTGWVLCDINECESIAGHMYRMGLMTFLLTEENNPTNLDRFRCLQIALVHDLAECIVGDLTPHCGVSPEEKHRREDEAMKKIAELTGIAGDRMYDLYKEYENQTSPEAKFAKDLDRYDMILQAFEYEKRENAPKKLQEFFTATEGRFNHPFIKDLVTELYRQREEFEKKSLVHDLAECIVGDLTPHCGVSPEEKHRREDEAMKKIAELTGIAGDRMYDLYKEYENQTSPEAKFAKDLDRYDMILQAFEYEKRENAPKKLQEFFTATEGRFNHPFIKDLVTELYRQREEFEKKCLLNDHA